MSNYQTVDVNGTLFSLITDDITNKEYVDEQFSLVYFRLMKISNVTFKNCTFFHCSFLNIMMMEVEFIDCKFVETYLGESLVMDTKITGIKSELKIHNNCITDSTFRINDKAYEPYLRCPEVGEFIGYKKCEDLTHKDLIVKLLIPADSPRISSYGSKCRCAFAQVLDIEDLEGNHVDVAYSKYSIVTEAYRVGVIIEADKFDDNYKESCAGGIHFFLSKQEAIDY